ncbi:MAG: Ca-activated chloride channel family protein [Kiritimatiellia bacterium]|jgi:Ca-activated chloride channel family protein
MDELSSLHFLRPWFLLLIPVLIIFSLWISRQSIQRTGFEQWIDKNLLAYISTEQQRKQTGFHFKLPYLLLAGAWIITSLALAGPSWQQLPQALHQSEQAMVVILDLSPSMRAEDNKPSRIVRARLKIQDLLSQRKDGLTALVVYAGEAHIVTPLTNDSRTIINLLSTLEPGLLPIPGSNIEMAVTLSKQLIKDSGLNQASLVVVTDGIHPDAIKPIGKTLNNDTLFIIGIGTEKGAPIPTAATGNQSGDFLRDSNNNIVNAVRNDQQLKQLAQATNGYYLPLQADDSDIVFIIKKLQQPGLSNAADEQSRKSDRSMDKWEELGPSLLLLFLPLLALMFRRGYLLSALLVLTPSLLPEPAYALSWDELWLNDNQRAEKEFNKKNYSVAEETFDQPQWQGSSAYKDKRYQAAADAFGKGDSATDHYNKGNALSQLGQYDEAIASYDSALARDPGFEDAKKNKQLVEALKKEQEEKQQDQKNKDGEDKDNNKDNKENKDGKANKDNKENGEKNKEQSEGQSKEQKSEEDTDKKDSAKEEKNKQAQKAENEQDDKTDREKAAKKAAENKALAHLSEEEKQELEQWIRKIPDDPSGLLRRKFKYEFEKRRQLYQSGKWTLPDNNAHERY